MKLSILVKLPTTTKHFKGSHNWSFILDWIVAPMMQVEEREKAYCIFKDGEKTTKGCVHSSMWTMAWHSQKTDGEIELLYLSWLDHPSSVAAKKTTQKVGKEKVR